MLAEGGRVIQVGISGDDVVLDAGGLESFDEGVAHASMVGGAARRGDQNPVALAPAAQELADA